MKNNLNTQRDINTPEEHPSLNGAEIVRPEELLEALDTLQDGMDHDIPITSEMIHDARRALQNVTVGIGHQEMKLQSPEMQENRRVWKEILNGNFEEMNEMTVLTDAVAKAVARSGVDIHLLVRNITNKQAKILAGSAGNAMYLTRLATITDEQADAFSEFEGDILMLSISQITDRQAAALATCRVNSLRLDITRMTDEQAKIFATSAAHELEFRRLTHITDAQAEIWSTYGGNLALGDLRKMTEKQAELLAARKNLTLWLTKITDEQAKGLAHFKAGGTLKLESLSKISQKGAEYLAPLMSSISCPGMLRDRLFEAWSASRHNRS